MAKLNIDIPAELKSWIEREAKRRGVSQRVVVILALELASGGSARLAVANPEDETGDESE